MEVSFYTASVIAVLSTFMVITRSQIVHALLYLILSLLSVAVIYFILGATFAAAIQIIIYAGAIMVLLLFVIMMLNLGADASRERLLLAPSVWIGPVALSLILLIIFLFVLVNYQEAWMVQGDTGPKKVGLSLFGPYMIGVELASILLTAGLVGAFHLGRRKRIQ
jgi:NADH-quinone oxidoreductase subunit J